MFKIPAHQLLKLSKVYRRKADRPRIEDTSIQRHHDTDRSVNINRYMHHGFPWSDLKENERQIPEYNTLKMPGWLPTAIIVNILPINAERDGNRIHDHDVIEIQKGGEFVKFILPEGIDNKHWNPDVPPIEIIDGQHRLWAFNEEEQVDESYELPVIAFYNLDITWQAYLFYVINIKPKKINASLAFDLYPILRIQDWLEQSSISPNIYRETRAQEMVEALWSSLESPWYRRINMTGERKGGDVGQAAFIRSLLVSYIKRLEGKGISIGGLFGAELTPGSNTVLRWNRTQQAAFLIFIWNAIKTAVAATKTEWATHLRALEPQLVLDLNKHQKDQIDPAFSGRFSLLSTDQGVRGILQVTNDMCYIAAKGIGLNNWYWNSSVEGDSISNDDIRDALIDLNNQDFSTYIKGIAAGIITFDFRTSSTPNLPREIQDRQLIYRGSSGYKQIRHRLLDHLLLASDSYISQNASEVLKILGY